MDADELKKVIREVHQEDEERRHADEAGWKWDKHIPVALIATIFLSILTSTAGSAWWLSTLNGRVATLEAVQAERTADVKGLAHDLTETNTRVTRIEDKIDSVLSIARRLESSAMGVPPTPGRNP